MNIDYETKLLKEYEYYIFEKFLTQKLIKFIINTNKGIVCDSWAVRAYTDLRRSSETDIDFLFKEFSEIEKFIDYIEIEGKKYNLINIDRQRINKFLFVRIYFAVPIRFIPIALECGNEFIIDLHIGAYFYKNDVLFPIYDEFFIGKQLLPVKSICGLKSTKLPVPDINELFIFKLVKNVGKDSLDLFSLIMSNKIDYNYIFTRIFSDSFIMNKTLENTEQILKRIDILIPRWEKYYFKQICDKDRKLILNKLKEFVRIIKNKNGY